MYFTQFVLFFSDCDSATGITNLRPTHGTFPIRLRMNTFCFKKIDGPPAKFLGKQVRGFRRIIIRLVAFDTTILNTTTVNT